MLDSLTIAFHDDVNAPAYVVLSLADMDPDSGNPEDVLLELLGTLEVFEEERQSLGSLAAVLTGRLSPQAASAELLSAKAPSSAQLTVHIAEVDGSFELWCEAMKLAGRGSDADDEDDLDESNPLEALDGFRGTHVELYDELRRLIGS